MRDLEQSLAELRRRGLHLDADEAAEARARSTLLGHLQTDLRSALIRIVGFSRYLLEQRPTGEAVQGFVRRIGDEGEAALRELDAALEPPASGVGPRVSVSRHLHGGPPTRTDELFDPFTVDEPADQAERVARLELSMARSVADALGYRLVAESDAVGTRVTLFLR